MACRNCFKYPFCEKCEGPQGHCGDEKSKRIILERNNKMELDNEELKATKRKEKSADEMFEELGYEKMQNDFSIVYKQYLTDRYYKIIRILLDSGKIVSQLYFKDKTMYYVTYESITINELKAINKKCQEIGWI